MTTGSDPVSNPGTAPGTAPVPTSGTAPVSTSGTAPAATHRSRFPLWVALIAGGAITSISLGVRSTFGILLEPIAEGLDTQTGSIAIAVAVQNLLWGFSQPIAGAASDRFGPTRTLAVGGVLYALSLLLLSRAGSPTAVLLSGGFVTGVAIGAASFAVVLSTVGKISPPEKRSLNLGIVSAVGSLGQFVLVPLTQWYLDRTDWSDTLVLLAVVAGLIVLVAPFIASVAVNTPDSTNSLAANPTDDVERTNNDNTNIDNTNNDSTRNDALPSVGRQGTEPARTLRDELRRAGHSRSYLLLNGAFFVCGFHVTSIGIFLPGYAQDGGLSSATASTGLALIGLFNIAGSLIVGVLGQRIRFTTVLAWIYGLRAVVIAAYLLVPLSAASTIAFGMAMGLLWLATVPMTSAIVTQQFGPTHAGALFGVVFLSHQIGSFAGAFLGGELLDATDSYLGIWWIGVALGVTGMVLHLLIDESPVPEPPVSSGNGLPIVPAGVGVTLAAAGVAAALSVGTVAPVDTGASELLRPPPGFCVIAPPVLDTTA